MQSRLILTGHSATAAALVRITFLSAYGKTGDWLWDSRNLTIWAVVESNIGIIAGNLPCLKPFFRVVLGSTYGHGSRKTTAPQSGYGSRLYGAGTRQSGAKDWGALASDGTGEGDGERDVLRHHGEKESYMLTTIKADRDYKMKSGTSSASGKESPITGKSSTESLHREHTSGGLGGIQVDTEVNVVESHSPVELCFDDGNRREGKGMI